MIAGSLKFTQQYAATSTVYAQGTVTPASNPLAPTVASQGDTDTVTYTFGTGANQVNRIIDQVRTLNASSSEELNLFTPGLADLNGEAAPLTKIKFIQVAIVANGSGVYANSLTIGNAGTDPNQLWFGATNDTQTIGEDIPFIQGDANGKTIGAGTARVKIANNDPANVAWYRIVIGGNT